ncbi:hypothetical protein ZWY2020_003195 [Hordeum vulgare]|nr:hypothetical protein ZWY2020_003195 [Hordeum vulgare]
MPSSPAKPFPGVATDGARCSLRATGRGRLRRAQHLSARIPPCAALLALTETIGTTTPPQTEMTPGSSSRTGVRSGHPWSCRHRLGHRPGAWDPSSRLARTCRQIPHATASSPGRQAKPMQCGRKPNLTNCS